VVADVRGLRVRLRRAAVALGARPVEDDFALRLERVQRRIRIGQRRGAGPDRIRERAHAAVGEQHPLERRDVVEEPLRRRVLDLGMIRQRAQRLVLKRRHAGIELESAEGVRQARPRVGIAGPGQRDVVDTGYAAPDVHERLARREVGRGVDEPDVRRQREGDPDETVLAQIAEVVRLVAVGPEIVGVDRPEQRIVRVRIEYPHQLQESKSRFDVGRRQLEAVGRHVTVGARAAVGAQTAQPAIEERDSAAHDRVAWLSATRGCRLRRIDLVRRRR
jgi:hypothetical protein